MEECVAIVATHCPEGATVTPAQGVWQGCTEASATVTIIHPDGPTWPVRTDALCRHLCDRLQQSCVLVTTEPVRSHTYAARPSVHALAEAY
jgi:proteasome lid subunit RPN8/RPN11